MKILCLQLARLGDIYQTWPVLRALRRQFGDAEIDLVVRSRFAQAADGLDVINRLIILPTESWFAQDTNTALHLIDDWASEHNLRGYDRIINFSFSPASSYLTDLIGANEVSGYSRHSDGYLAIPDEASGYFYAQVGNDRSNRIHLTDVFAMVAQTQLSDEDFRSPEGVVTRPRSGIVVQIGASQKFKNLLPARWVELIDKLTKVTDEQVTLVGAACDLDETFAAKLASLTNVTNRVGQTSLRDLYQILSDAKIFVGCDSVGLHIATLTKTPTLNLSFQGVRFWETGPRAPGSRVIWYESPGACDVERVTQEVVCMLTATYSKWPVILKAERFGVIYDLVGYEEDEFSWNLIRALYGDSDWPRVLSNINALGFKRLGELASLALQQIETLENQGPQPTAAEILNQIDILIEEVGKLAFDLSPVVRWFQTEKSRIPPGKFEDILRSTKALFIKLNEICQTIRLNFEIENEVNKEGHHGSPKTFE